MESRISTSEYVRGKPSGYERVEPLEWMKYVYGVRGNVDELERQLSCVNLERGSHITEKAL